MAKSNHDVIIENINQLIYATGLTDTSIADMLEISIRKLKYLKSGKVELKLADVEMLEKFFDVKNRMLSKADLKINFSLREKLFEKYKNNPEFRIHFEKIPTLTYSLRYLFTTNTELEAPREIKEIQQLLNQRGWPFRSSSISQALARLTDLVDIINHPMKKGTFLYKKKAS